MSQSELPAVVPEAGSRRQSPISFPEGGRVEQAGGWEQFAIHSGPQLPHLIPRVMPVTLAGTGRVKCGAYPWSGLGSTSVLIN